MEALYNEIITKFNIKKQNIQIFDHSYQNNESLKDLEKAFEYFLSKTKKKDHILFMEFLKKIEKALTKIIVNKRKSKSYRKSYVKMKTFIFILIDPLTKNLLIIKLNDENEFFSFFCIEGINENEAIENIKKNMKFNFGVNIDILKSFSNQNNNHYNPKIYFCHINENSIKNDLEEKKLEKNIIFLNIDDNRITKNYEFILVNNYIKFIKNHLETFESQNEEFLGETRKKSISLPVKLDQDFFLDIEDNKDNEEKDINNPYSRDFRRRTSIDVEKKIKELSLNLDSILKNHNLLYIKS